jgi:hypothetical protein
LVVSECELHDLGEVIVVLLRRDLLRILIGGSQGGVLLCDSCSLVGSGRGGDTRRFLQVESCTVWKFTSWAMRPQGSKSVISVVDSEAKEQTLWKSVSEEKAGNEDLVEEKRGVKDMIVIFC